MSDVVWSFPVIAVIAPNFGLWLVLQNGDKKPKPRSRMTLDGLLSLFGDYIQWMEEILHQLIHPRWHHGEVIPIPLSAPGLSCCCSPGVWQNHRSSTYRGRSMRLDMAWLTKAPWSDFAILAAPQRCWVTIWESCRGKLSHHVSSSRSGIWG